MGVSSKATITLHIEKNTLEKVAEMEDAVTAAFEHLELVIESFYETRCVEVYKIVGNFVPEAVERTQKRRKTGHPTGANLGLPSTQLAFGTVFARRRIKNVG